MAYRTTESLFRAARSITVVANALIYPFSLAGFWRLFQALCRQSSLPPASPPEDADVFVDKDDLMAFEKSEEEKAEEEKNS